jgi:energy-coupling factor transporter transmembrane protein EcfT
MDTSTLGMVALLGSVALAVVLGFHARSRGRSFWNWFVLALMFNPILVFIILEIVLTRSEKEDSKGLA